MYQLTKPTIPHEMAQLSHAEIKIPGHQSDETLDHYADLYQKQHTHPGPTGQPQRNQNAPSFQHWLQITLYCQHPHYLGHAEYLTVRKRIMASLAKLSGKGRQWLSQINRAQGLSRAEARAQFNGA